MGTEISPLLKKRPYSELEQARADRQAWLDSQPQLVNNNDAPLVCFLGDMVADPRNYGTSSNAQHSAVAQMIMNNNPDFYYALGDNCYDQGMYEVYAGEYHRNFGQIKDRTIFVTGNHEITGVFNAWGSEMPELSYVKETVVGGYQVHLTKLPYMMEVGRRIGINPISPYTGKQYPQQNVGYWPWLVTDIEYVDGGPEVIVTLDHPLQHVITVNGVDTSIDSTIEEGWPVYACNDGYGLYTYAPGQHGVPTYIKPATSGWGNWGARNIGRWRWYFLNSCDTSLWDANSDQRKWLRKDLADHSDQPIGVCWHHPRWSEGVLWSITGKPSGNVRDDENYEEVIAELQATNRLQIVIVAHDHNYQRIASIRADGGWDKTPPHTNGKDENDMYIGGHPAPHPFGFEYFVVGCGGQNQKFKLRAAGGPDGPLRRSKHLYSENGGFGQAANYGALFLRLGANDWSWQFKQMGKLNTDGFVVDSGSKTIFGVPIDEYAVDNPPPYPLPDFPYPISSGTWPLDENEYPKPATPYDWPNDPTDPRLL